MCRLPVRTAVSGTGVEELNPEDEGECLVFESTDDNPIAVPNASYSKGDLIYIQYSRSELLETLYRRDAYYYSLSNLAKKFVKYLTGLWAYSDGYTWSKTNTTTVTGSSESGVTFAKQLCVQDQKLIIQHLEHFTKIM